MSEVPLYHRIYTHAPDAAGVPGGRPYSLEELDAQAVLRPEQLRRLDMLLESIVPPPDGRAWALCRFAGAQHDYACLIVSRTARDAEGRSGVLTHARLAEVDARAALLDLPALADVAEDASEAGDVAAFARRLRDAEPAVPVAPWSEVNAAAHDRQELSAVLAALLAGMRRPEDTLRAISPGTLRVLIDAWPLLPLVFQRKLACTLDAQEGVRVPVMFAGAGKKPPAEILKLARRYADWLFDRPDDARRLIETMPGPGLTEFQQALNDALEPPMPTKKSRAAADLRPQPPRGTLDPQLVEYLNEQIRAGEDSMYEWLEEKLARHGIEAKAPRAHRGAASRPMPSYPLMAVGAVALLALLGGGWMGYRAFRAEDRIEALEQKVVALSQGTGVELPAAEEATETAAEPERDPLREPELIAGKNWAERFQWVADNRQREIVPDIVRVAQAASLSAAKKQELQRMVDVLQSSQSLAANDRRLLRAYLFELIAAERVTDNRRVVVDGTPSDVPAAVVRRVKEELRVATPSNDPADADLQSEVVLRWIAQQR
jgi:hypothetical protein